MRQRLGVAHALLGDPKVLILDEPANGLDPAGIHWMRGLLREFADGGGTVLLSSHLLREIEVIADELVVIGRGRIVATGAKKDLLAGRWHVRARARRRSARRGPDGRGLAFTAAADGGGYIATVRRRAGRRAAFAGGAVLVELRPAGGAGLEEMFLRLTAADAREEDRDDDVEPDSPCTAVR